MYVGFTKLILVFAIGAAQTPTASSSSSSGNTATDLINSATDAASSSNGNGNTGNRFLQDEDTCVCSPRKYTFTLNFSGTCPGNFDNEGVIGLVCYIDAFTDAPDRLTPVVITSVTVLELDEDFDVLRKQDYLNAFDDGDTIQYTSISDSLDPNVSLNDQLTKVPRHIEFIIIGENEQGEVLENTFLVQYTLSCEVEPIAIGNQKGWVEISDYLPAIPAFCGAVTYAPTVTPSEAPTESPTFNSMSYHSASFSVSHAKTAKAKAVKAKGGKISKRT